MLSLRRPPHLQRTDEPEGQEDGGGEEGPAGGVGHALAERLHDGGGLVAECAGCALHAELGDGGAGGLAGGGGGSVGKGAGDAGGREGLGEGDGEGHREDGAGDRGAQGRTDLADGALGGGALAGALHGDVSQYGAGELRRCQAEAQAVEGEWGGDEPAARVRTHDKGEDDDAHNLEGEADQDGARRAEAGGDVAGGGPGEECADGHRGQEQAGGHDGQAQRINEVERQDENDGEFADGDGAGGDVAPGEGGVGEQAQVEECGAFHALAVLFPADEQGKRDGGDR